MKKIISLISAVAMIASFAINFNAFAETTYTEPTIYFDVEGSTTELKAGDKITIAVKYAGFNVSPYDDANTGNGEVLTSYQAVIKLPGTIGTAATCLFKRGGSTVTSNTGGSFEANLKKDSDVVGGGGFSIPDLMSPSGTLFTASLVLNQDVTGPLVFAFDSASQQQIAYDSYTEWESTTVIYNSAAVSGTQPLALGEDVTLGEAAAAVTGITISPKDVETMEGGESKDFTATVTGTGAFDTAYELTASAGTITDNKTFTAPEATEVEQTITITATATGNSDIKDTVTIKVPAKVVVPDPEFKVTATKILKDDGETPDNYYTEDKTVQRFNCLATDYNLAGNSWVFTFSSGETHKPFTVDMTTAISGGAAAAFEAWIIGAPDDVTLSITDAE